MSMLSISGRVLHVFEKPQIKRDAGVIDGKPQVQIMGKIALPNGESRYELVTLSTDSPRDFENYLEQNVSVQVGVFSPSKGSVIFFIPQGTKPVLIQ